MRETLFTVLLAGAIAGPLALSYGPGERDGNAAPTADPAAPFAGPTLAPGSEGVAPAAPASFTVAERLARFGPAARARLRGDFHRADVAYPPARVRFAAFKAEARVDLFAAETEDGPLAYVRSFDMTAGPTPPRPAHAGPKRRAGDRRVPEGLYPLGALNPNSVAHVSVAIGYPNRFDRARMRTAGGTEPRDLGGDIMIHGGRERSAGTEGCLALDDRDMEEVFTLIADMRRSAGERRRAGGQGAQETAQADILIAPQDFRRAAPDPSQLTAAVAAGTLPDGTPALYREIGRSLDRLPVRDDRRLHTLIAAD